MPPTRYGPTAVASTSRPTARSGLSSLRAATTAESAAAQSTTRCRSTIRRRSRSTTRCRSAAAAPRRSTTALVHTAPATAPSPTDCPATSPQPSRRAAPGPHRRRRARRHDAADATACTIRDAVSASKPAERGSKRRRNYITAAQGAWGYSGKPRSAHPWHSAFAYLADLKRNEFRPRRVRYGRHTRTAGRRRAGLVGQARRRTRVRRARRGDRSRAKPHRVAVRAVAPAAVG